MYKVSILELANRLEGMKAPRHDVPQRASLEEKCKYKVYLRAKLTNALEGIMKV